MRQYKCLKKQEYTLNEYKILPIRSNDRYELMKWRNEQLYHLRQSKLLDKQTQDTYFDNVISKLFQKDYPDQILFSYLEDEFCIGYGGLVHINWADKNAEISFLMNTELENDFFEIHWKIFLKLIEQVAFEDLNLHKIFTYAFDLRPKLYNVLEEENYTLEARLKEHSIFNNNYIDVLIHSKVNGSNNY